MWLKVLARSGYAARGVVYLLVGGIAVLAAFEGGDQPDGSSGALKSLIGEPFGKTILGLIAAGLVGYSVWRSTQALFDTDRHGHDIKGLAIRGGLIASAFTHVALAYAAATLALNIGSSSSGSGNSAQQFTHWLMAKPFGAWMVGIAGITLVIVGVAHLVKAYKKGFQKWFDLDDKAMKTVTPICMFGLGARGVVWLIVGGFFLYAGFTNDPDEAGGLQDAMRSIRDQSFGQILVAIVAAGLFAFGAYSLIESYARRVTRPLPES